MSVAVALRFVDVTRRRRKLSPGPRPDGISSQFAGDVRLGLCRAGRRQERRACEHRRGRGASHRRRGGRCMPGRRGRGRCGFRVPVQSHDASQPSQSPVGPRYASVLRCLARLPRGLSGCPRRPIRHAAARHAAARHTPGVAPATLARTGSLDRLRACPRPQNWGENAGDDPQPLRGRRNGRLVGFSGAPGAIP